jgi:hypothetical protein
MPPTLTERVRIIPIEPILPSGCRHWRNTQSCAFAWHISANPADDPRKKN